MSVSYSEIIDRFNVQSITRNQESAADAQRRLTLDPGLKSAEHREFHRIDKNGWSGDLNDLEGVNQVFDSQALGDTMNRVLTSLEKGRTGDVIVSCLEGDILATEKRAFRDRHQSWIRRVCHASARQAARGNDAGVYRRNILGYLEDLLKVTKDSEP